jgi:hypothetical protein
MTEEEMRRGMRHHRCASSWRYRILAALGLLPLFVSCDTPTDVQCGHDPVLVLGMPTGWEKCSNGVTHRASIVACPSVLPRANHTCVSNLPADTMFVDTCQVDADCLEKPNGYCKQPSDGLPCACAYGCVTDADCMPPTAREVCLCGDPVGFCAGASCKSDADCKSGLCTRSPHGDYWQSIVCVSPENECEIDADCYSNTCSFSTLAVVSDPADVRVCRSSSPGPGCK